MLQANGGSILLVLLLLLQLGASSVAATAGVRPAPWVVAHRGSSGDYPELTMLAFQRAADEGADMLELDTAVTSDHHVIVLHEPALSLTTDVATRPEFASRRRTDQIDSDDYSENVTDFLTWDFTLAEVQQLRKRQRMTFRDSSHDGKEAVPTLRQAVQLVKRLAVERRQLGQRPVALLIEVKLCRYFTARTNRTTEDMIAAELQSEGVANRPDLIHLQTFELACASELKRRLPLLPVYKLEQSADISDDRLAAWQRDLRLDGIGVHKAMVAAGSADPAGPDFTYKYRVTGSSGLVERAHRLGNFKVLVWTLRNEDRYIAWTFSQDGATEMAFFTDIGVDGLITDFPKTARRVVDARFNGGGLSAAAMAPLAALMAAAATAAAAAIDL